MESENDPNAICSECGHVRIYHHPRTMSDDLGCRHTNANFDECRCPKFILKAMTSEEKAD